MSDVEHEAPLGALGDALARRGLPIVRPFLDGLRVGLRAARDVRHRRALVALVLILATLWLLSSLAQGAIVVRRYYRDFPESQNLALPSEQQQPGFVFRWLHGQRYHSVTEQLVRQPLWEFAGSLSRTDFVTPWASLVYPLILLRPTSGGLKGGAQEVIVLLTTCAGEAVALLIMVPLLGWIRDRGPISVRDLPRYWRAHYAPLLALGLLSAIWAVFHLTVLTRGSAAGGLSEVAVRALDVLLIVPLVLMLTPFVIVGRSTRLWEGIVGGLRLLGRNWAAVVALFLCFWIGHQLIAAWAAIPPWPEGSPQAGFAMGLAAILWQWASTLATALLGLWLACALMDIARAPRESLWGPIAIGPIEGGSRTAPTNDRADTQEHLGVPRTARGGIPWPTSNRKRKKLDASVMRWAGGRPGLAAASSTDSRWPASCTGSRSHTMPAACSSGDQA